MKSFIARVFDSCTYLKLLKNFKAYQKKCIKTFSIVVNASVIKF